MNQNAVAISLTLMIAGLLGVGLWWDAQRTPTQTHQVRPAASPEPPVYGPSAPRAAVRSTPGAGALVRCERNGSVTYQAGPCPVEASQDAVDGGTFSIVSPPKVAIPKSAVTTTTTREEGAVGFIAQAPSMGERNAKSCESLEREIARIDEAARRGGSAQYQEYLKERRRELKDEMWRLKCGF